MPFPHSFITGAKPAHSSPSLENSIAGGRDERVCTWLRPQVPRTHSEYLVGGPPKGLNYLCSTGGQIPKIPGNRVGMSWVGLETSLGDREGGESMGGGEAWTTGHSDPPCLAPVRRARAGLLCSSPTSGVKDYVALGQRPYFSEPQCQYSQKKYSK